MTYPGMGHDLSRELWPAIADEIAGVAGVGSRTEEEHTG